MNASSFVLAAVVCLGAGLAFAQDAAGMFNVRDFGAKGDGKADDTAAFQKALDAAGKARGGVVFAPVGNYRFEGNLDVPRAVTIKGTFESVPAHNGIRDKGLPKPGDDGTTFFVTGGAGSEEGPAFLTLHTNSTLKGVVVYYPDQHQDKAPKPYPYTIAMRGKNPAVIDVELLNPYNGIDATQNERHFIRNVHGQPLRRGIYVDAIYDIGRIENVHWNPWWCSKKVLEWQKANGEAFIFGRSDWEYVLNTFCYGYKVGYKFIKTKAGECNGNFLGIGADDCWTAMAVEECAPYGLLITNGEFVSFRGPDPTMVEVTATNNGSIRFNNCAFWGPCNQIAKIAGVGTTTFSDCNFCDWARHVKDRYAIQVAGGSVILRGCDFQKPARHIQLGPKVRRAVVMGNLFAGPVRIENESKGNVQVVGNAGNE